MMPPRTILVATADPELGATLRDVLEGEGWRVLTVTSGTEVLRATESADALYALLVDSVQAQSAA